STALDHGLCSGEWVSCWVLRAIKCRPPEGKVFLHAWPGFWDWGANVGLPAECDCGDTTVKKHLGRKAEVVRKVLHGINKMFSQADALIPRHVAQFFNRDPLGAIFILDGGPFLITRDKHFPAECIGFDLRQSSNELPGTLDADVLEVGFVGDENNVQFP